MASPVDSLRENLRDVRRLLELHEDEVGTTPGRKYDVEVLNKSGVVLALACWEAFVEDCAVAAFDFVLQKSPAATGLSTAVRKHVVTHVRDDKNDLAMWALADSGWRQVLTTYRESVLRKRVSPLNTPSAENVDDLYDALLGLQKVSDCWRRHKMTPDQARTRLQAIIKLRGDIAHRTRATRTILKNDVREAADLAAELASMTANRVRQHVHGLVGSFPWDAEPDPPRAGRKPASERVTP